MPVRKIMLIALTIGIAIIIGACDQRDGSQPVKPSEDPVVSESAAATAAPTPDVPTQSPSVSPEPGIALPELDTGYEVAAQGLQIPWAIAFDNDIIYISERRGSIVRLNRGEQARQEVQLAKKVHHEGEGGFLGFVLSPDFTTTQLAYAYHTYKEKGETLNRIVLLKQEEDSWLEQKALLEGIPGDLYHNGGRIAIGPDQMLYVTTGDAQKPAQSQDTDSVAGKILRMTLDGQVPEDNPFPNSYVYSYGHRNPQGLDWNADGDLYSTEHGPSGRPGGHDEINIITAGSNYGWPNIIGDAKQQGMVTPIYHTGEQAIAPSGTVIDAKGRLLIAALVGEALYRYDPSTAVMEVLFEGIGRIRDVKLVGDKFYLITNNRDGRGKPSDIDDQLLVMNYRNS